MKIKLVTYDDYPPQGGQGTLVASLRRALQVRGDEVTTVAGRGNVAEKYPRLLGRAPLDFSLMINRNLQLVRRGDPDVVQFMGGPGGVLLARDPEVPVVYLANHTYHLAHPWYSAKHWVRLLERRGYEIARQIIAVSSTTAGSIKKMGIDGGKIRVIMPGIEPIDSDPNLQEPKRVLFVGRLFPEKGAMDAVRCMKALVDKDPQVHGVVVGNGPEMAAIKQAAGDNGHIEIKGSLPHEQLNEEFARASVLLMPSRYEGLGLVALEAASAGVAVVGYDVAGLGEALEGVGIKVAAGDTKELFAQSSRLLEDDAYRAHLALAGKEVVRSRHAWPKVAEQFAEVYRLAIGT